VTYRAAIEKAVALLRQGYEDKALDVLERALANVESVRIASEHEEAIDPDDTIELAYDPRRRQKAFIPPCYIDSGELVLCEEGWEFKQEWYEGFVKNVKASHHLNLTENELTAYVQAMLAEAVHNGLLWRKE